MKEYVHLNIIKEDIARGELLHSLYENKKGIPACPNCFANKEESPQCRYVLENTKLPWDLESK